MILKKLLDIHLPIVQAPMAGVQDSALTLAVSNAGGLGSLPCATLSPQTIRRELEALKANTARPFNLNFFCHTPPDPDLEREAVWRDTLVPYYDEYGINPADIKSLAGRTPFSPSEADLVEEFKPAVVSFHFGLPEKSLLSRVKASGAKVLASATTVEEARWLERRGADVIIAQGLEAGGHRGMFLTADLTTQIGTFSLVEQIVRAVCVPVIAAGGIASAEGVAAAMKLGAAGVQVGSAYLLCPESRTSELHRQALRSEAVRHTAVTNVFTGRPARSIVNRIIRELGPLSDRVPDFPLATTALLPLRREAEARSCDDFTSLWAGQNVHAGNEMPAAELTRKLADGVAA